MKPYKCKHIKYTYCGTRESCCSKTRQRNSSSHRLLFYIFKNAMNKIDANDSWDFFEIFLHGN